MRQSTAYATLDLLNFVPGKPVRHIGGRTLVLHRDELDQAATRPELLEFLARRGLATRRPEEVLELLDEIDHPPSAEHSATAALALLRAQQPIDVPQFRRSITQAIPKRRVPSPAPTALEAELVHGLAVNLPDRTDVPNDAKEAIFAELERTIDARDQDDDEASAWKPVRQALRIGRQASAEPSAPPALEIPAALAPSLQRTAETTPRIEQVEEAFEQGQRNSLSERIGKRVDAYLESLRLDLRSSKAVFAHSSLRNLSLQLKAAERVCEKACQPDANQRVLAGDIPSIGGDSRTVIAPVERLLHTVTELVWSQWNPPLSPDLESDRKLKALLQSNPSRTQPRSLTPGQFAYLCRVRDDHGFIARFLSHIAEPLGPENFSGLKQHFKELQVNWAGLNHCDPYEEIDAGVQFHEIFSDIRRWSYGELDPKKRSALRFLLQAVDGLLTTQRERGRR